jgi:hypothetical protein
MLKILLFSGLRIYWCSVYFGFNCKKHLTGGAPWGEMGAIGLLGLVWDCLKQEDMLVSFTTI